MKKKILVSLLLITSILLPNFKTFQQTNVYALEIKVDKETEYEGIRVLDGDTIEILFQGKKEHVRLIGVDTPESVHKDKSKNTREGKIASDYTKKVLTGKKVTLEFDVQQRDKYGRLLAYVYLDGKMFNETLLEQGYAKIATFPPNIKYVERFKAIVPINNPFEINDNSNIEDPKEDIKPENPKDNTEPEEPQKEDLNIIGNWKIDDRGKLFELKDGTYVKDRWFQIENEWYYFDKDGYAKTNAWISNYYLKSDGKMAKNEWIGVYYVKDNGSYARSEWIWDKNYNAWYYLKDNGVYANDQWQGSYYLKSDGKMAKNEWIWDKNYNAWYYLKDNGYYAHNEWVDSYYLKGDGIMATNQWILDKNDNSWYYLGSSGKPLKNQWISGTYYVKSDGKMAINETTPDCYRIGTDGAWIKNSIKGNKRTKIYHLYYQKHYNDISFENIIWFDSEEDAQNAGYRRSKI